jgi:hypothetical protein
LKRSTTVNSERTTETTTLETTEYPNYDEFIYYDETDAAELNNNQTVIY